MSALSTVIGRGTLAARPAAGNSGRIYYATDGAGTLYRDNGSSWDSIETSTTATYVSKHAVRACDTSAQAIANATLVAVALAAADIEDTDNFHFTSAANLTGTVAKTASSAAIVGTGTSFTTELTVGQMISVPGTAAEVRVVTVITDNTHLTVNSNFANSASGQTAARVNTGLVAMIAGDYDIGGTVTLGTSSTTGARLIGIRLNGATYIAIDEKPGIGTSEQYSSISTHYPLALYDYVELIYRQSTGGSVNLSANTTYGCQLWMSLRGV